MFNCVGEEAPERQLLFLWSLSKHFLGKKKNENKSQNDIRIQSTETMKLSRGKNGFVCDSNFTKFECRFAREARNVTVLLLVGCQTKKKGFSKNCLPKSTTQTRKLTSAITFSQRASLGKWNRLIECELLKLCFTLFHAKQPKCFLLLFVICITENCCRQFNGVHSL